MYGTDKGRGTCSKNCINQNQKRSDCVCLFKRLGDDSNWKSTGTNGIENHAEQASFLLVWTGNLFQLWITPIFIPAWP